MLTPNELATGATYFIVSPKEDNEVFELVKVLTMTSPTRPISSALRLKPVSMFDAMSAAEPKSTAPAEASDSIPGIALSISSVLKPAMAR